MSQKITIDEVLTRGVSQILPSESWLKTLMQRRKITLYCGYDPTAPSLHLGHLVTVRKLGQFQKLGHKVIFMFGDFTGRMGDPTDKRAARTRLTKKQVEKNLKEYLSQVRGVIDFKGANAAQIKFNSHWLEKLNFADVVELASKLTVQQMIERDFFQKRLKDQKPIFLHEFLYPLLQGYDSVAMNVDLEIGGNDQLFNMMAGRTLMKVLKKKEKFVLTTKMLADPQGKKMGKTEGNAIFLSDSPEDIFGKIMSLPDSFNQSGVEILTDLPLSTLQTPNPLEVKKAWTLEVVKQVHGAKAAKKAQHHFEKTFQQRKPEYSLEIPYRNPLVGAVAEVAGSKSEAKRLIKQGAVDVSGVTIYDPNKRIEGGEKLKIGKKTFVRVKKRR